MNPNVIDVKPLPNHELDLTFSNQERRIFDVKPYLDKGVFSELKDEAYFKSVKITLGSIEWPNEQDFSKDTLYLLSNTLT